MFFDEITPVSQMAQDVASHIEPDILQYWWHLPVGILGIIVLLATLAFLFIWVLCLCVDQSKPQTKDSRFYRGVMNFYIRVLIPLLRVRVHTEGLEQAPKSGRFLLVCNHLHECDPVILLRYFRKSQLAFINKRESTKMFIAGPMMHKIMCQPINRENDKEALKTIINCIRLINEDKVSIGVFPEGYIRPDRLLRRFRSGVFKIAQKTKVPIVVCTIRNTHHVLKNAMHLKPTDVDLHLIKTIQPEEYAEMTTVELGEWIYQMMAADLGPDLVAQEQEENP